MNLSNLKDAVQLAYSIAEREARRCGCPVVHSRGRWVATMGGEGDVVDQCSPMPGAEAHEWRGTKRELERAVEKIEADYPEVKELWVEGGFDGADSVRSYTEGDYEPWIGSWDVLVWTRAKGWLF